MSVTKANKMIYNMPNRFTHICGNRVFFGMPGMPSKNNREPVFDHINEVGVIFPWRYNYHPINSSRRDEISIRVDKRFRANAFDQYVIATIPRNLAHSENKLGDETVMWENCFIWDDEANRFCVTIH